MAKFITAATDRQYYPEHHLFECCLIGRSNVGKSTLINALAKTKIAFTSKTPGRTRTINFYDFHTYYLVDLPGYGYAKLAKNTKLDLALSAEEYLHYRPQLMSVVHVCDINVITNLDLEMKDYLTSKFDNYILCLNKADKLSYGAQQKRVSEIIKLMNLAPEKIIVISGKKNINIDKLSLLIKNWTWKK